MDLNKLSLGDKIVAGGGILLFLALLIFPWHEETFGEGPFRQTFEAGPFEGEGDAVAWPAVIAILLVIAVVAAVLIRKLTTTELPELPIPWNQAIFYATIAIPALLILKWLLFNDYISVWAYIDILLGIGMAAGGYLISQEANEPAAGSTPPTPF
ncbi:MAG TPA: hypothetical protein VIL36_16160 [Acidimicrobiales bacterium]